MNHPVETQRTDRAVDFAAWKGLFSAMIGIGGWMLLTNGVETIVRTGDASASALFGLIGAGAITGGAIALALISIGAGVAASTLATDYAVSAMASVTIPGRVMIGAVLIVGGAGVAMLVIRNRQRDRRLETRDEGNPANTGVKGATMTGNVDHCADVPVTNRYDGQALIEMALVLMIVLVVIFGGVAAVQAIGAHYTVSQAVRIAAHQAALRGSTGGLMFDRDYPLASAPGPVADAARTAFAGSVFAEPQYATIRVRCATNPCRRYSTITVTIGYRAEVWTPIPGLSDIQVNRSATRTAEQDTDH